MNSSTWRATVRSRAGVCGSIQHPDRCTRRNGLHYEYQEEGTQIRGAEGALRAIESAHQPGEKGRTSVSLAHTPPRPEEQKSEHQHGAADPVPDERKQPDRVGGKPGYVRSDVLRPLRSVRSEEHTSELQSLTNLVCRLL